MHSAGVLLDGIDSKRDADDFQPQRETAALCRHRRAFQLHRRQLVRRHRLQRMSVTECFDHSFNSHWLTVSSVFYVYILIFRYEFFIVLIIFLFMRTFYVFYVILSYFVCVLHCPMFGRA